MVPAILAAALAVSNLGACALCRKMEAAETVRSISRNTFSHPVEVISSSARRDAVKDRSQTRPSYATFPLWTHLRRCYPAIHPLKSKIGIEQKGCPGLPAPLQHHQAPCIARLQATKGSVDLRGARLLAYPSSMKTKSFNSGDHEVQAISSFEKLPGLHGLRGIAALMIVLFHLATNVRVPDVFSVVKSHFGLSVPLFFVLSGFSLMYSTSRYVGRDGWLQVYLIKRFFRIAPLFYVMIAFFAVYNFFVWDLLPTPAANRHQHAVSSQSGSRLP